MFKYIKDLLKVLVFILLVYLPMILFDISIDLNSLEKAKNKETIIRIINLKKHINEMILQGKYEQACQRLAAERSAEAIFYFSLTSTKTSCQHPANSINKIEASTLDKIQQVEDTFKNNYLVYSNQVGEVKWSVVANYIFVGFFKSSIPNQTNIIFVSVLKNLIIVFYIFAAFVFLTVLIMASSIQNQYRKLGKDPKWLFALQKIFGWLELQDIKLLKFAAGASIKRNEDILKDQDLLETSLEASILNEIKTSKLNIPYTFKGTVAKVDINGFSKVVSAGQLLLAADLTNYIEIYGCEMLMRYGGLFEKTIGDEIVVVFKSSNSVLLATAFVRDLMKIFESLEFELGIEKRKFTLKGSIYSSDLVFLKKPSGYGFSGEALTVATRLLEVITLKEKHVLSCVKEQINEIQELIHVPSELQKFNFKNMNSAEGYFVDHFLKIQDIYDTNYSNLIYFRSDEDLIFMLKKIQFEEDHLKLKQIFNVINETKVHEVSEEVVKMWIVTLKIFEKRVAKNPELVVLFSRLIVEGSRLIPTKQWSSDCTDAIMSISRYIEGRINASVVDVLIEKDLNDIVSQHENNFIFENDHSYRTRGNLVLNQAITELSNSVFEKVIKMIKSNNSLESSTGIYTACKIIIHYRKVNPAALETFISYQKLSKVLHQLYSLNRNNISTRLLKLLDQVHKYNELTYKETYL